MILNSVLILALSVLPQVDWDSSIQAEIFTAREIKKLEKERNVNDRIKIYTNASKRIQKKLHDAASRNQFHSVPGDLELWTTLLSKSYEDIKANLNPRKKSKNLIKFEIQVRESLADIGDYRLKAPIEQQDAFNTCLTKAESIRKKLVEIIFPR